MTPWPKKSNTCAVVVTYHPDKGLRDRIVRVLPQVAQVIVVDNSSRAGGLNGIRELPGEIPVHLVLNKENMGIAAALNQGLRCAVERGYRWALLLDHDSVVAENMLDSLAEAYEAFPKRDKAAVIGSNYQDAHSHRYLLQAGGNAGRLWEERKTVITSGSLVSLEAHRLIGPFRDEFFVDCVDLEYCLRARSCGFKIIVARRPLMQHAIGTSTMHRLPWKMTGTSNHAPLRRYYMTRNRVVLMREYLFKEPAWVLRTAFAYLKSTILLCLFEQNKLPKLRYTTIGLLDGIFCNYARRLG